MIELPSISKNEPLKENNEQENYSNNDQQKNNNPKRENRSSSQKKNKVEIKNQNFNNDININLSVSDINKMLLRHQQINYIRFYIFRIYISLTLLLTNTTFIFFLAYLRPIFLVNEFYCYDLLSKHYSKCLTDTLCKCDHDHCVTFCYEEDFSKCYEIFKKQSIEFKSEGLIKNHPEKRRGILEYRIIYPMKANDNLSLFQKIGKYYCLIGYYNTFFMLDFGLGCFVGFYIFGILCDLYGKKKVIIVLSILVFIFNGFIATLANFTFSNNHITLLVLWFIVIFLFGICLEPLESAIYVYFLEMYPSLDFIKPINCLLFVRYLISLVILVIFNNSFRNLVYFMYGYEGYILIFIFVFGFIFTETPRFYSERRDNENKAKAFCFFTIDDVNFTFIDNEEDTNEYIKLIKNQHNKYKLDQNFLKHSEIKVIDYAYIHDKLSSDNRINKGYKVILFSYIIVAYCFYTILLKFIYFFCDPHNYISKKSLVKIFALMIILFILVQLIAYFIFEIFALNLCISVLLFPLFICCVIFDKDGLYLDSYRNKLFESELYKKDENTLSACLWFITYIVAIYEMMLLLLSPTLYRSYFFFCQKGFSCFSIGFAFFFGLCN